MFGYYHPQILPHPHSRRFTPGREVPGPLAIGCTQARSYQMLNAMRVDRTFSGDRVRRPSANFLQVELGHPGGNLLAQLLERRGREAKAQAVWSTGAVPRWAQSLNRSQSRSRDSCQSHGSLQSHPCHFQKLGPTVQLKCSVHSANRWRIERGQE